MVNTTAPLQNPPTQLEAATMECHFEPPMDAQHKGLLTYPLSLLAELVQIGRMETGRKHFRPNEVTTELSGVIRFRNLPDQHRAEPLNLELNQRRDTLRSTLEPPILDQKAYLRGISQNTQSLDTKHQAIHPAPKTTAQLEPDTEVEKDNGEDKDELNMSPTCLQDVPRPGFRVDQRPLNQHLCNSDERKEGLIEPEPTHHIATIKKDYGTKLFFTSQDPLQDHQMETNLCTPTGEIVLWQDVKWERYPYAEACQDSTDLLRTVPGHYHLQATHTAEALRALVQTNLHSQFYNSAPKIETKVLGYSLGSNKAIKNPARSDAHLQFLEAKKKKR